MTEIGTTSRKTIEGGGGGGGFNTDTAADIYDDDMETSPEVGR